MDARKMLTITNSFGNVDLVHSTISANYVHIKESRLQPICRKLGVRFAPAIVAFDSTKNGTKPVICGVVVTRRSAGKVLLAIAARNTPEQRAKRERQALERAERKAELKRG